MFDYIMVDVYLHSLEKKKMIATYFTNGGK